MPDSSSPTPPDAVVRFRLRMLLTVTTAIAVLAAIRDEVEAFIREKIGAES
jgi:hypothetical protein